MDWSAKHYPVRLVTDRYTLDRHPLEATTQSTTHVERTEPLCTRTLGKEQIGRGIQVHMHWRQSYTVSDNWRSLESRDNGSLEFHWGSMVQSDDEIEFLGISEKNRIGLQQRTISSKFSSGILTGG
jgi:hypothetical protein